MCRHNKGGSGRSRSAPATNGANPPMANTIYQSTNGHDKSFAPALHDLVGRIRYGWAVASFGLSASFLIASLFINYGFLTVPAKESDMKVVQATLAAHTEALKAINGAVDKIDRRLDRVLDRMEWEASAPAAPRRSSQEYPTKKQRLNQDLQVKKVDKNE